jgi:hypothetical protein
LLLLQSLSGGPALAADPVTERIYLSGKGPSDAVLWDFTVSGGARAGEQARIPVPSNWEQHGFGAYRYGQERAEKGEERGRYRLRFAVPRAWKGRRIRLVFEGVMTDATVTVNGVLAGPIHQGAFYRFHYDVTKLVKLGESAENNLEVLVAKTSANFFTNRAERQADYWVFGGIFRPVWLEATPSEAIEHVAIDARADGTLSGDVTLLAARTATRIDAQVLAADGRAVGAPFSVAVPAGGAGHVRVSTRIDAPKLWTAETPNLYSLRLTLSDSQKPLHQITRRFGFRTFEVRPGKGLYLNGQRILLKGVNRHSFRPATARALDPQDSYDDVRMIRAMNMNAVRMSHYPPDEALLEAADEIGLYVLDELSGWQNAHDTDVGRLLVRAMIERDVNHPSILFWDNGNEGGWNRELDREFDLYDPQKRRVLHPWELHDDIDTKHYPTYPDLVRRLAGPHLVMPTEVLHGLYDGGHGAGLEDYWNAVLGSPVGAGLFLWSYADEGIARTDQGGRIDVYSTFAPDGIVGPNLEKEGSFFTIRDLWSPVQIQPPVLDARFDGTLQVANGYDFTALDQVRFQWRLLRFPRLVDRSDAPRILSSGEPKAPAIAPHGTGQLKLDLPADWRNADALAMTAWGADGKEIWSWTWPTPALSASLFPPAVPGGPTPVSARASGEIRLSAGAVTASFDAATGMLRRIQRGRRAYALSNGPRLTFARPASVGQVGWLAPAPADAASPIQRPATPGMADLVEVDLDHSPTDSWLAFKLEISPDGAVWRTVFDGSRRPSDGNRYRFAPQTVAAIRVSQPRNDIGRPLAVKAIRAGFQAERYPAPATPATVTTGTGRDPRTGRPVAWLESRGGGFERLRWTLHGNGSLQLDYGYALRGDFLYHGITFDQAPGATTVRTLAEGPYRVWQNRLRGTQLGVHRRVAAAGVPEFEGYFAGLRWASFDSGAGGWAVTSASPDVYLRIGTPLVDHPNTSAPFPPGDLSFLHVVPAMGSKFVTPENTGPASQPAMAEGSYGGTLFFTWTGK